MKQAGESLTGKTNEGIKLLENTTKAALTKSGKS